MVVVGEMVELGVCLCYFVWIGFVVLGELGVVLFVVCCVFVFGFGG